MVTVRVTADVNPTEDAGKVKAAVLNLISATRVEVVEGDSGRILIAEASTRESLHKLRRLLIAERIRDAARAVFFKGFKGQTVTVCFNKQAAYMGHVSFSQEKAESPLGPIRLQITAYDAGVLIDWLAPSTWKGARQ